ncbi:hypothetical protein SPRG_06430 [Saprolegnia parasitica CBS 223.65]|uniref:Uncharacterized protein n=1 Tax=Saprolegnia parasitica (strain CBS 223.65) TaxID=695850 RepID=A0A067CDJ5_SAPPC|nr:hypothetical protein SPRG_06430 [Saprolegnia parasitica CBS 223.65]KDO28573.1 hypothetical protein SPRG_06430 [Saprolegnia parasitica CBS 223.65]|eukprot:XP_012200637.1 hypothetical protein SPRG_06430 [Saprolegnia parasitica CBS 223.65]
MPGATESEVAAEVGDRIAKCDKLTQGRELNLADLELHHVPPSVLGFSTLIKLNLRHNHLSSLPIDLVESVPLLEVLNVAENALTNLPPDIGGLPRLRQLFAQANRLRSLPLSLMNCSKLQEMYVQHNAIRDLPDEFAHLTSLSVLSLAQNDLVHLPKSLNSLQSLKVVDLSGNAGLTTVPELLRRLHEKNLVLHSKEKRRELIARALKVKTAVAAALKKQAREVAKI